MKLRMKEESVFLTTHNPPRLCASAGYNSNKVLVFFKELTPVGRPGQLLLSGNAGKSSLPRTAQTATNVPSEKPVLPFVDSGSDTP